MKTTIYLIFLFIAVVFISLAVAYFLTQGQTIRYEKCILLQSPKTGQVDCFGCNNDICKDAPIDWLVYLKPPAGPFYTCQATDQGCKLSK